MKHLPFPVMMFAAGFGTRMGDLTRDQPKPMIPVAGRALIDHAIDMVRSAGTQPIVVNTHYKAKKLERHLTGAGVITTHEAPEILDTGGGLKAALPLLGPGPVMTVNPDVIWKGANPLMLAAAHWDPARMDALLVCVPVQAARGRLRGGDFSRNPDGRLRRKGDLVYSGVQIIAPETVARVPESVFSLNHVWNEISQTERLFGVVHPGPWCDVGRPEGIGMAENMLLEPDV